MSSGFSFCTLKYLGVYKTVFKAWKLFRRIVVQYNIKLIGELHQIGLQLTYIVCLMFQQYWYFNKADLKIFFYTTSVSAHIRQDLHLAGLKETLWELLLNVHHSRLQVDWVSVYST